MWPKAFWEKLYEPIIRSNRRVLAAIVDAGMILTHTTKAFLHCDLLVIGAGPAGLSAALAAGRSGARVILADEDFAAGGRLNAETLEVDGMSGADWAANGAGRTGVHGQCADHDAHHDLWRL